ncbi:MAG: HD domain-containing protein [Candidatus Thiodiazotropha endolucinida]|nr:HD domain-containing protein [Candidatus Thiodiazotropha taylori]MCW4316706.1 HD domain-containing protein [Candidatus Thiodiazotropha taylori]
MKMKAEMPISLLCNNEGSELVRIFYEAAQLKQLYRQGWLRQEVPMERCESVADHSFLTAFLSMLLVQDRSDLDALKVLQMALLHDLGEAYVGDITPNDNVPSDVKVSREREAVISVLDKYKSGKKFIVVWEEYIEQITPEAKFVKEIDRLELFFQSTIYEKQGLVDSNPFVEYAKKSIVSDNLIKELEGFKL